ncbi:hypothetical protein [Bacillus alkalicellulosilyticus]|nr:hypothetical protein [Bacillus alkalicellulosilyticus]
MEPKNDGKEQQLLINEAIKSVTLGIGLMVIVFLIAHYVFHMPFFPQ